jgi:eukaryotic-like serine/threonine-protein kinase
VSLSAGDRLGPYEIQSRLGAGGMGEVYEARDTRLDRRVAVKVLPPHYRSDPELHARFEREAKTISALSHPHICTLFDVGRQGDVHFLVMEHLEGETLAERVARGPLPVPQALDLAIQMARALDAAHRQRIVHRDLKPGNVMLTRSGRHGTPAAKLLDFGLARLVPPAAALEFPTPGAPTMTTPLQTAARQLTGRGSILGTLQYMAPEQIEGRDADARSDIFALGITLYEMLTGRRPFEAKSQAGFVAAILEQTPPPFAAVAPAGPLTPGLEPVVMKCLAKDPDARWQSAGDLADALTWIRDGAMAAGAAGGPRLARWQALGGWGLAAACLVLIAIMLARSDTPGGTAGPIRRLAIEPPAGLSFTPSGLALSPDGSRLVFGAGGQERRLYMRPLDRAEATPLPGTDGGRAPFFSPDGEWVGFFTDEGLKKVSIRGGQPVLLSGLPPVSRGGTWLPDDTIVFTPSQVAGMWQLNASGGDAREFTPTGSGPQDGAHLWPQVLPGGRDVLMTVRTDTAQSLESGLVVIHSSATGDRHPLVSDAGYGRYLPSGHLAFVRSGTLMVAPLDLEGRRLTGTPTPLIENVLVDELGGPHFAAAPDGTLVYLEGRASADSSSLVVKRRTGEERAVLQGPAGMSTPRLARDGRRALVTIPTSGIADLWVGDIARGTLTRLTHGPLDQFGGIWSHDDERIFYSAFPLGHAPQLFWIPPDRSADATRLAPAPQHTGQFPSSVSPDGRWLLYSQAVSRASSDIWVAPLGSAGEPRALVSTPFDEFGPEVSRDGRWVAYTSNESGRYEVYVVAFPGPGPKIQISRGGGASPVWAPGGGELFYLSDATVRSVSIDPNMAVGDSRALFDLPFRPRTTEDHPRAFETTADGQSFLIVRPEGAPDRGPVRLNVVLNWAADLTPR